MKGEQLIFVYNADGGIFGTLADFAHKIFSPSTYSCNLCALTHGDFIMKHEWRSFIQTLPLEVIFLHRDAFQKQYNIPSPMPGAFLRAHETLTEIISKQEIEGCASLDALKLLLKSKIEAYVQHHHSNI